MTSLTGDSASFFSRSVRVKGQSSPQDVACSVFVSLRSVTTCLTGEHSLVDAVPSCCVTTVLAAIGGVLGVDLDPPASSVFRFGAQNRDELPPRSVTNASVESGLGGGPVLQERSGFVGIREGFCTTAHVGDCQILHNNQVIARNECPGGFVVEVATLVGDLAVPSSGCLSPVPPVVRGTLRPGQPNLRASQTRGRSALPAGVTDVYSVGGGCETSDSQIDSDLPPSAWQRINWDVVARQDQRPPPTLAADLNCLDQADDLSVRSDLHLPNPAQIHPVGVGMPTGAVAVFGPLHTVEPSAALKSRIPWCRTVFHTSKESVEGAIQSAQRGLLARKRPYRHVGTISPNVLELTGLGAVADGRAAMPPRILAFLQCRVVQLPMRFQTRRQCEMLAYRRSHPELVGSPHVETTSDRARHAVDFDACNIVPSKYGLGHVMLSRVKSTHSTRIRAGGASRNRRRCLGQWATRWPSALSSPAQRRERVTSMLRRLLSTTDKSRLHALVTSFDVLDDSASLLGR